MNWITILQFFASGFALIIGVFAGALIMAFAIRNGDKKKQEEIAAQNRRVEDRLAKYVEHSKRIADAIELLAKNLRIGEKP
jgi:uncharacterized membrane-anchored protein YhcB (DUF1043 family)